MIFDGIIAEPVGADFVGPHAGSDLAFADIIALPFAGGLGLLRQAALHFLARRSLTADPVAGLCGNDQPGWQMDQPAGVLMFVAVLNARTGAAEAAAGPRTARAAADALCPLGHRHLRLPLRGFHP